MPRAKPDIETKLTETALRMAARDGWNALTLDHIAKASKIAPAETRKIFPDKNHILPAIIRLIDRRAAKATGKADPRATPHDRLFEAMMARFDTLQEHRGGILAIIKDCGRDPLLARLVLPAEVSSMRQIFANTGVTHKGVPEPLAVAGLLAVYYRALWCWQRDQTPDMARTMAALDQGLRCAGKTMDILFRNRRVLRAKDFPHTGLCTAKKI